MPALSRREEERRRATMLVFEPESHTYTWFGVPVPSLTVLMADLGWSRSFAGIPEIVMETARIRGTQVHAGIDKYLAKNPTFVDELSEASAPFFDSFLAVVDELPLTDEGWGEIPIPALYDGNCIYGCIPDRVEPEAILEFKATSRLHPSAFIQLCGQAYALGTHNKPRGVVHLLKSGKPAKVVWDEEPDKTMRMWLNDLDKLAWKKRKKW
jgi:hypothetical protein